MAKNDAAYHQKWRAAKLRRGYALDAERYARRPDEPLPPGPDTPPSGSSTTAEVFLFLESADTSGQYVFNVDPVRTT